ncbi:TKL/STKR/TYPE2 protein kinase [Loa loa]|uniref:Serine/threonine-protein kinase receptor n=1 Tax=Loa loa TaxID=7209 RepID=A0A1S0UEF0_LOALO|nr:TKL/STKR/TYPE2 protein kinase [Loa loa]EFO28480.2 TKL/STKR/TYPE2 protein kinase [Loa loa]
MAVENRSDGRVMFVAIFIASSLLISTQCFTALKHNSLGDILNDDTINLKESSGRAEMKLPAKPVFLKKHGVEGLNYNLDNKSRPFIYCDFYDVSSCDPMERSCPTTKMCYASVNDHRLGCMAALVNNSLTRQVTLKGCWMHDGNLGNCDNSQCIADERPTGHGNAALFCCCSTHYCNRRVQFPPQRTATPPPTTVEPTEVEDPGFFGAGSKMFAIIILGFFSLCALALFCYYSYREYRNSRHYKEKAADAFSMPVVGDAKLPLIGAKNDDNLKNIINLELVARGRFGQVFRGVLDNETVAVKVFPPVDVNSWIVEQEIYAIASLRRHKNILRYLGAEVHGNDFWLITEFHDNGSLFDFLHFRVLTLQESLKVIASMLKGLSFLHEEKMIDGELKPCVVHRDFKSRNVLLKSDLTSVIADFGLALKCENGQMPSDDNHGQVGTRRYMSPEILEGATEFTAFAFRQIDVYASALVLWEILSRTSMGKDDVVGEYERPYEAEAGVQPTLHDMRRVVAVEKKRPSIRAAVMEHNIGGVLWKTAEDMWDMEPDGRITSGCAYERANTLFMSYAADLKFECTTQPENSINGALPSYTQEYGVVPAALLIKDGSLGSNGFHASMEEYAQACTAPPNVRYFATLDTEKVIQDNIIPLSNQGAHSTFPLS